MEDKCYLSKYAVTYWTEIPKNPYVLLLISSFFNFPHKCSHLLWYLSHSPQIHFPSLQNLYPTLICTQRCGLGHKVNTNVRSASWLFFINSHRFSTYDRAPQRKVACAIFTRNVTISGVVDTRWTARITCHVISYNQNVCSVSIGGHDERIF